MDSIVTIVVISALATTVGLAALLGPDGRAAVYKMLGERFGWWKPPPAPVVEAAPPPLVPTPPPRPEIRYGNIAAVPAEQEQPPDLSLAYEFPEKAAPTLRYADLNTRLLIVVKGNEGSRRAYPEHVSDAPYIYRGNQAFFDNLVRKQLRPAYPTILDPGGLFTAYSALLERQPGSVATFGSCDYIDLAGRLLFTRRPPPGAAWWLQFVPGLIKQETCLFRKDAVVAVGGLNVNLRYAMDLDLLLRLRRIGSFERVEMTLAAFCWHPGSITIANREVSFAEAQRVQRREAGGIVRLLNPVAQPLFRQLLLAMSKRINTRHLRDA